MDHRREHHSLLAGLEKHLLIWIAARLPARVTSDQLTVLALASMLVAGVGFALAPYTPWSRLVVVAGLAANWFGDSLDGTVARVRRQERPRYGFYVDHVTDLAGTALLMSGLAASGLMAPVLAIAVAGGYFLVCGELYLATHAAGVFRLSFIGFGATELRIVLAVGALAAIKRPSAAAGALGGLRPFDVGGLVALVGLLSAFVVSAVRQVRELYRAEPLTKDARQVA